MPGGDCLARMVARSLGVGLNHGGRTLGRNGGPLVGPALVVGAIELVGGLIEVGALVSGGGVGVGAGGGVVVVAELVSGSESAAVGCVIPGTSGCDEWLGSRAGSCVVDLNTGFCCGCAIRVASGFVDAAPGTAIDNKFGRPLSVTTTNAR